jgi:integrase
MAVIDKRCGRHGLTVYRVRVRLQGKPLRTATFPTLAEARQWGRETEVSLHREQHFLPEHACTELIAYYREHALPRKQPTTQKTQVLQLDWWAKKLCNLPLPKLTSSVIVAHRNILVKHVSPATANRYIKLLSHVCTVGIRELGWLQNNPCANIGHLREPRGRTRWLNADERERLLAACRVSRNPYLASIVTLALATGLRRGELLSLTWTHVNLTAQYLTLLTSKNGEPRYVPLTDNICQMLNALPRRGEQVFPSGSIRKAWETAVRHAGLQRDVVFHTLRHTCGSCLAMSGASLADIAEVLGHRSLEMARRYTHLSPEHVRSVVERMNTAIFG